MKKTGKSFFSIALSMMLVIALTLTFTSCGQKKEETKKEDNSYEKVAALYEEQIKNCKEIDFNIDLSGTTDDTYKYKYALAYVNDDDMPELLIQKIDKSFGLEYNKTYYYDKENNKLLSPNEILTTGVSASGGYRGGLSASNKKDGLILDQAQSGTGEFKRTRFTLEIKEDSSIALKDTLLKETTIGDESIDNEECQEITWYEIDDLSILDKLKTGKLDLSKESKKSESNKESKENKNNTETKKSTGATVDNKTVFQGTLKYLSYNDVLSLQGIDDPNPGYSDPNEKFALLVFDGSINLTATNGDGQGSHTGAAKMIKLNNFSGASKYNGKKVKVKITSMYWPSDTSLPIGEPYALEGKYKIVN